MLSLAPAHVRLKSPLWHIGSSASEFVRLTPAGMLAKN
jgi:hypothetical protein